MRFSFLAVLAALTASMDCRAVGKTCEQGSDCCSDACAYKSDCSGKVCIDDDSIHGMQELARRENITFKHAIQEVQFTVIPERIVIKVRPVRGDFDAIRVLHLYCLIARNSRVF
ncbi:hypothetical protein EDB19DRAFT_1938896 [Suillus lakei]|nr:hypothetical protein EDB19DRAFT_1938896 [Suillus lakei]